MPNLLLPLVVVVAVVIVVVVFLWVARSALVATGARVNTAWTEVAAGLRERAEKVPALLAVLRQHTEGDTTGFAALEVAREESLAAETPASASIADTHFQSALSALLASAEAYPKLQSSEEYLAIQSELAAAANQLQSSRRLFNGGVRELNVKLKTVPGKLFGSGLGLHPQEFFEVDASTAVAEPPRIQF